MQDFVRIRIADAADEAWVGERSLERVNFGSKRRAERSEIARENIDPSRIDGTQPSSPTSTCNDARRFEPASVSTREP